MISYYWVNWGCSFAKTTNRKLIWVFTEAKQDEVEVAKNQRKVVLNLSHLQNPYLKPFKNGVS